MGNSALFWPNRMEEAVITGPPGGWLAAAPASNVGTDQPSQTARSASASTSHTKIYADLGATRMLRAFAVQRHNLSIGDQWRILLGTSSGGSEVLATSWMDCWIYSTQLAAFAAIGVEDGTEALPDEPVIGLLAAYYGARYVTFEFDATNPVEVGLAFAGGGLIPEVNDSWGRKLNRPSRSTVNAAESGAQWPNRRHAQRSQSLKFEGVSPAERRIFDEMQRRQDICRNVLYVPDVDDPELTQREGFIGLLRELSSIENPELETDTIAVEVTERG